jgi:Uma2 family endonuclease
MSTAVATEARYTPEDLLAMPDSESYELVHGKLLERKMGVESSGVGGELLIHVGQHCKRHGLGRVLPADTGYQCFPHDPDLVRKADVSFIRKDRLPGGRLPKGWAKFPPDLAVEIVSPNDLAEEVEEKLVDYRRAGVPLVWVIYPGARTARIHRSDGSASYLSEDDELSGEDVIPGFRCPLREILPPREQPEPAQATSTAPNGPG